MATASKFPDHALHKILNERVFRNVPILQNPSENYFYGLSCVRKTIEMFFGVLSCIEKTLEMFFVYFISEYYAAEKLQAGDTGVQFYPRISFDYGVLA